MTTPPLIGLSGRARTGKDTLARFLAEDHGYVRIAFADALREAVLALDPIVDPVPLPGDLSPRGPRRLSEVVEALGWEGAKDYAPEVRRSLQRYGTAIRAIDPDFWIHVALEKIFHMSAPVVVTDVRLPNEAEKIRDYGGFLVRVTRPGFDEPRPGEHESESALDDYPFGTYVRNIGTVEDLRSAADAIA